MSVAGAPSAPGARSPWLTAAGWRGLFRDRPTIPLLALLAVLVILSELVRPGIVNLNWGGVMLRTAVPLAILAGCQVLTMLTGGIDLSVGAVASMSGFLVATLVGDYGLVVALLVAMGIAAVAGLLTGIGVGVFRVHPLIMTLGMGLVVFGFANAWQLVMVQTGGGTPAELRWIGSGSLFGIVPHSLLVFVPLAALILFSLRRTGLRPAAVRRRRQPDRGAPVGRPVVAGADRPVRHLGRAWRRSPGSCSRASRTSPA